jgi:hypothetical protein
MQVVGIAVRSIKRAPLEEITETYIDTESGLMGDFRSKIAKPDRKITVLFLPQWEEVCQTIGVELPWHTRRANICLDEERAGPHLVGKRIYFNGELPDMIGALLEITGETEPCIRMDEAYPGLKEVIASGWRGGHTCRVLRGGPLMIGTQATICDPQ